MQHDPELSWWRLFRTIDDIEIFAIDLTESPKRREIALDLLDEREAARYDRFKVEGARRQFLFCRSALRMLLGDKLGRQPKQLSFESGKFGKPHAVVDGKRPSISFNVSHSGDDGLIAIATSRSLGVDLEQRRPLSDLDGVAAKVFGSSERDALSGLVGSDKVTFFHRLWTFKEALIKAKGTGFSYDPIRFQVPAAILDGGQTAMFAFPEDEMPAWVLTDLGTPKFAAALAYRRQTGA